MKNKTIYIVTRDGRRIEEENYFTYAEAKSRAGILRAMLAEWDPSAVSSVGIAKTDNPRRIR